MIRLQSGGAGRKTRACINLPHVYDPETSIHEKANDNFNACYLCAELSIQPPMILLRTTLQFQFNADQLTMMDQITRYGTGIFRAAYIMKLGV